jgi:hypothetical protein
LTYAKVETVESDRCYVVKNGMGKVMKPPGWTAPDIVATTRATRVMSKMQADKVMAVPAKELEEFRKSAHTPALMADNPMTIIKLRRLEEHGVTFITEDQFYTDLGFKDQEAYYAWRRSTGDMTV